MQERNANTNLFLKKIFIMKSHVTTCHYSLFLYKMQGQSHPMTQEKEILPSLEFLRPCAIHKNLLTKKLLCHWVFMYAVWPITCPASCCTYILHNSGQRAFAVFEPTGVCEVTQQAFMLYLANQQILLKPGLWQIWFDCWICGLMVRAQNTAELGRFQVE